MFREGHSQKTISLSYLLPLVCPLSVSGRTWFDARNVMPPTRVGKCLQKYEVWGVGDGVSTIGRGNPRQHMTPKTHQTEGAGFRVRSMISRSSGGASGVTNARVDWSRSRAYSSCSWDCKLLWYSPACSWVVLGWHTRGDDA
ncbi:hypothetical protein BO71DRAFT_59923 [Aspergillus ellipticus CBS 707.79]|uniref:Secreted protein n=1 Tax=Aspergillus ellipticus CBS 707.79 TaxID=1448320 RepID=A0A319D9B3_9EURO|nr:hypothetical protein BO71DRAFT_59923 [Aspergillus ellipticus CBS 707.79]